MTNLALVYAAVPRIACVGKCREACGPIDASDREKAHFERATGKPFPNALHMLNIAIQTHRVPECPYLDPLGQCSVYQNRPLICRLYGVVPSLPCRFGCKAEGILSEFEARRLFLETQ